MRARNLWSEQPLSPPAEDVITGLEFLVDLPMCGSSWVSRMKEKKDLPRELLRKKEEEDEEAMEEKEEIYLDQWRRTDDGTTVRARFKLPDSS